MKFFIILLLFLLTFGVSFANSDFSSKLNIFENYLKNQKLSLEKIADKYDISSIYLDKNKKQIINIIETIKKIKYKNLTNLEKETIINSLSKKIKYSNETLKKHLKKEIEKSEKKLKVKKRYLDKISYKLEKSLEKILKNYTIILKEKDYINKKDEKIINNLLSIKNEIVNLKNFRKVKFESEKSLKLVFLKIIISIKNSLFELKNKTIIK